MRFVLTELFDPAQPETRGQRVQGYVIELLVLLRAQYELWQWSRVIPHQPGITHPAALGRYLDVSFMLRDPLYPALNALLCGALMMLGITRRLSAAYALAFLSFSIQYAARFGLGKVQHGTNMLGMALLALAVSHLAFRRDDLRRKAVIGLTVALLSVGYLFAASSKLRMRGIHWVDGQNLWLWIREKRIDSMSGGGNSHLNVLQGLALSSKPVATALLSFGLLSELSAALMWWRPARRWVMLGLAGMHLGISFVMNIYFTPTVLLLLSIGLPIPELVDRVLAWRAASSARSQLNSAA